MPPPREVQLAPDRPSDSRHSHSRTDEDLVESARDGQVRALETLLDRHQSRVLRVLSFLGVPAQDREDVAQEIFIRVFRHLRGFRRGQEFAGWLYRVTVNAAHDYRTRRGKRNRGEAPWSDGLEYPDDRPGPAESLRDHELREALESALETLSERERAVFVLREMEGLESAEVARALGIHAITVRRHLARARKRLKAILESRKEHFSAHGVERPGDRGSSHG